MTRPSRAVRTAAWSSTALPTPKTDFLTARTGFVVLHPLKGVVGNAVEVEHVDGKVEKSKFPARVNPIQPFLHIRALTHEFTPGIKATVRFEGDTWEMEDHRNWTDASFKTYVRPLALPWPYTLTAGESVKQSVKVTLCGNSNQGRQLRRREERWDQARHGDAGEPAAGRPRHAGRGDRSRGAAARPAQACGAAVPAVPIRPACGARLEGVVRLSRVVRADRRRLRARGRGRKPRRLQV